MLERRGKGSFLHIHQTIIIPNPLSLLKAAALQLQSFDRSATETTLNMHGGDWSSRLTIGGDMVTDCNMIRQSSLQFMKN